MELKMNFIQKYSNGMQTCRIFNLRLLVALSLFLGGIQAFAQTDTDGDGMSDAEETTWGLNINEDDAFDDSDGDRYPNIFEIKNGLNPLVFGQPAASPTVLTVSAGADLQALVDGISANDYLILILESGGYAGFTIDSKNVLLIAEDPLAPPVFNNGLIWGEDATIGFDGLEFDGTDRGDNQQAFYLRNCRARLNGLNIHDINGGSFYYASVDLNACPSVVITNCVFTRNSFRTSSGPSVLRLSGSSSVGYSFVQMDHCTFLNDLNSSGLEMVGLNSVNHDVSISNSIFWSDGDTTSTLIESYVDPLNIVNCIVGGNALGADPLLTVDGGLLAGSPAIDAAVSSSVSMDIHGESRPFGGVSDIGADELVDDDNGDGTGDGLPDWWEERYFGIGNLSQGPLDDSEASFSDTLDDFSNVLEYKYGTSPILFDTTGDGQSDLSVLDTDEDGMNDFEENLWSLDLLVDDAFDDSDGDRYPNIYEVKNGSDPMDRNSKPDPSKVKVLDPAGGGHYSTFEDAVGSMTWNGVDFEILEVRPGRYTLGWPDFDEIEIFKPMMIVSSGGAEVTILDQYDVWTAFDIQVAGCVIDGFSIVSHGDADAGAYADVHISSKFNDYDLLKTNVIQNCVFTGAVTYSSVWNDGGDSSSYTILRNVLFRDITSEYSLIDCYDPSNIILEHCTFIGNQTYPNSTVNDYLLEDAHYFVGDVNSSRTISYINCILADQLDAYERPFSNDSVNEGILDHSIVYGSDVSGNPGNVLVYTGDPNLTARGYLQSTSTVAIDQAMVLPSIAVDLEGELSSLDGLPDIGADQFVDADNDSWADWWIDRYYNGVVALAPAANDDADSLDAAAEYYWGTDPFDADSDWDGLTDSDEVLTVGTSPANRDTDGDWLLDGGDPAPLDASGFQASGVQVVWHSASDFYTETRVADWLNRVNPSDSSSFSSASDAYMTSTEEYGMPLVQFGRDLDLGTVSPSKLWIDQRIDGHLNTANGAELFVVLKAPLNEDISIVGDAYDGHGGLWSFAGGQTRYPNDAGWIEDYVGSSTLATFDPKIDIERLHLYHVSVSDTSWTSWINGYEIFTRASNDFSLPNESIVFGTSHDGRYFFTGEIAEILVFSGTLSEVERAEITDYLLWQYKISKIGTPIITSLSLGTELLGDGVTLLGSDVLAVDLEVPDYVDSVKFYVSADGVPIDEALDLYATDTDGSDGFSTYMNLVDRGDHVIEFKAKAYNLFSEFAEKQLTNLTIQPTTLKDTLYVEWLAASDEETAASQLRYQLQYSLDAGTTWSDLFTPVDVDGEQLPLSLVDGVLLEQQGTVISYIWDVSEQADYDQVYLQVRAFDGESYSDYDKVGPYDLDNGAPVNTSVLIASGDVYTTESTVALSLSADGATEMWLREDGDFFDTENANWQSYSSNVDFTFASSNLGLKSVYVKYRDSFDNETTPVLDTVTLRDPWDVTYNSESLSFVMDSEDVSAGDSVLIDGVEVTVTDALTIAELTLINGARLTHPATTTSQEYRLNLEADRIELNGTSSIDVSGRGYLGGRTQGNAVYTTNQSSILMLGGSHGGLGGHYDPNSYGDPIAEIYGDYTQPIDLGSGADLYRKRAGGGAMHLICNELFLDAESGLYANGVGGTSSYDSGGAGGSIWIKTDVLYGGGAITASGGSGTSSGSGGGGGRIAVYYDSLDADDNDSDDFDFITQVSVEGGVGGRANGGAGTLYTEEVNP